MHTLLFEAAAAVLWVPFGCAKACALCEPLAGNNLRSVESSCAVAKLLQHARSSPIVYSQRRGSPTRPQRLHECLGEKVLVFLSNSCAIIDAFNRDEIMRAGWVFASGSAV